MSLGEGGRPGGGRKINTQPSAQTSYRLGLCECTLEKPKRTNICMVKTWDGQEDVSKGLRNLSSVLYPLLKMVNYEGKICSRILLWGGHGHLVAFALAQNMFKLSLDTFSHSGVLSC